MATRYARLTLVLVLVALVPTVVNSYLGSTEDAGPRLATVVPETIDGFTSAPTDRREASIQRSFSASDWVERRYTGPGGEATLLVVRSFDMKRVYHHPELAVASMEFRAPRLETVASPLGDIAVHVLEDARQGMVAYTLIYGDETVAAPLWFQLRVAPELLLRGRRPLTLALAVDRAFQTDGAVSLTDSPAVTLVTAATDAIRRQR